MISLKGTALSSGSALALAVSAFTASPALAQDATNNQPGVPVHTPQGSPVPGQQVSSPAEGSGPSAGTDQPVAPTSNTNAGSANQEIVITGTLIPRRTSSETPSPVTVISQESMDQRGITTAGEALQRLSANGAASIGAGWNNGNNFAAGASAPSLRGLTVQKTLSIFDGLRMAPYPVADDGHRNFVDISTIPDNVIDRIEVLKDGASSTYGADAVAGVVNLITKKEIQGVHGNVAFGESSRGDGRQWRVDGSMGYGDLDRDGFNVYVAGTWRKDNIIYSRDRDFPINSGNYTQICGPAAGGGTTCLANPTRWATFLPNASGSGFGSSIPLAPLVAPANAAGTPTATYQLLNSNCAQFNSMTENLSAAQRGTLPGTGGTTGVPAVPLYPATVCGADLKQLFGSIQPETERYGVTARATIKVGEKAQAYMEGNYFRTHTFADLPPVGPTAGATLPPPNTSAFTAILPVYVCPQGVATIPAGGVMTSTGCTTSTGAPVAGAVLNPNNPFAAAGQTAIIRWRYDRPQTADTVARSLRAAGGISGTFGGEDEWNYNLEGTASEVRWTRSYNNYVVPQRLADVIANGTFNFSNLSANSEAVRQYITPEDVNVATSNLWQVNATIGRSLFALPGGPLAAAVGVSVRHEAITDPSANPVDPSPSFNPYTRYFTINAVGATGSRNVKSGYFELNAPILSERENGMGLEVDASGRYDKYSTGQKNFSPKIGAKFTPIRQLALRGTWSRGFRIPSFNESFGLPTTGYTTNAAPCPSTSSTTAAFCTAHANDAYATTPYQFGRTATGNPNLAPEKSTSITAGAVFEPIRNLSFTVDYFNIKTKDTISQVSAADQTAAINAYFATGATNAVPGATIIPAAIDPNFPTAQPLPGFVAFSYQNADQEKATGIDFSMSFNHRFGPVKWSSYAEASYLMLYEVIRKGGAVERYDGTLSPCDYTSCSGSPKWRGNWQNTLDFGRASLTATVYYTSGYDTTEVDYGGTRHVCPTTATLKYLDGVTPVACHIGPQWNADLSASFKVNHFLTIYGNVLDFLDIKPKFDPMADYGIFNYNVIWGQANAVGRFFRIGAKVDFVPRRHEVVAPVVLPPPPPPPPATVTCESGAVIQAPGVCPPAPVAPPPPPPPPAPAPERG
jgi:iron complex outermembrane receptor protein